MQKGGESGKLGNAYEGIWTIHNELDLLRGDVDEMIVEPLRGGRGIEFIKVRKGGIREFHSVKIQTTKNAWTVAMLAEQKKKTGRSILGDLIEKLRADPNAESVFVSEVTANPLKLICDDAKDSPDLPSFRLRLSAQRADDFRKYILPLFAGNESDAFDGLKRLRVVSATCPFLVETVEREISRALYRPDGRSVDPRMVRLFLGDIVLQSLGQVITQSDILTALESQGFRQATWSQDASVLNKVRTHNNAYLRGVRGQLINSANIHRHEADDAFKVLIKTDHRIGAFVGVAGLGKSCTAAEFLDYLENSGVPYLALRLDDPFDALTPRNLGLSLDFPMSPVDLLSAIANGGRCVLLLDQLDALSIISGRNLKLWGLVDALLEETKSYPNMRVWLACRAFDLEHDPQLRQLFEKEKAHQIMLRLLTPEEVCRELRKAGVQSDMLGTLHIEALRTPMNLSLYLQGDPANQPLFTTVQDLYRNYWDRKRDLVRQRLGREPHWIEVIDVLCDKLSADQVLSVRTDFLDDPFRSDARAMASENVLACEGGRYKFFHETFFDYAFARRYVRRGKALIDLLLKGGEQHLFRRSQVRQILTYLREDDSQRYVEELSAVLQTPGVRAHIIKLVLDWLRTVDNPMPEELALLHLP